MNSRNGFIAPWALATAATALILIGCRPSEFQYVEGVITLDGVPVEAATVTFRPREKGGMMAAGMSDASGRYRLNPLRGKDGAGALVGEYDVSIIKTREPNNGGPSVSPEGRIEYVTPPGYADTATSGLTATITPGRNTGASVSFDLTSTFRKK
jgi:hypothetical protein